MARRPSAAQLRLLLALIAAAHDLTATYAAIDDARPETVRVCRARGWVEYTPDADRYKIGRYAITEAGRLAAAAADPRGYQFAKALAALAVEASRVDQAVATRQLADWETDFIATAPAAAPNPHYHCSSAGEQPCPTGEHVNPHPSRATRQLAEALDDAIPPAVSARALNNRIVAAAAAGDQITVIVAPPPFTSACLGEISPVHATGVALRLRFTDMGHGRTAPAHVRMGGAAHLVADTFPPAAQCSYRDDTGHCEASHEDECREIWRRELTAERFGGRNV